MEINKKISLRQFLPLLEAEIQDLLNPAEASVVAVSPVPSSQSESPLALISLALETLVSFKVCTQV
jgi:hypothetical protein